MFRRILLAAAGAALACASDGPTGAPTVATVTVTAGTSALWATDTLTLTAVPRAANGAVVTGRPVAWSTSDTAVAMVDAMGRVTAVEGGTVTVSATIDGVVGGAALTVTALDLVYEGYADLLPELFVLVAGDPEPRRLLQSGTMVQDPTPSPDGTQLLFTVADYTSTTGDLFVADLGTGLSRPLTSDSVLDDQPDWSPDGSKIAFRSYRGGYLGEIWVMNADGSGQVNLTPTIGGAVIEYRRPAWSPDGTRIAYASTEGGDWGIWIMDPDGGNRIQLTATPELDAEPTWSPDGTRIAFRRNSATDLDIMVLDLATMDTVRLALPGHQRMPSWSPDGRLLAFVGHMALDDQPEIYTMRPDGGGVELRTTDPARRGGLNPGWRPRTARP